MKKIISMVLSFILILGCSTTAFAAETHNYDTENLPHDGADYFETEIKADEENEERISDFVTVCLLFDTVHLILYYMVIRSAAFAANSSNMRSPFSLAAAVGSPYVPATLKSPMEVLSIP